MSVAGKQTAMSKPYSAASTDAESVNPFRAPGDDMIFTFKDDQKQERTEKREAEKQLRVWEKNRPMREGCLRKLCETEIEPSALAINPKVQGKIQVSEAGGMNIPVERPKNRESRWQLIEKKREMFLVQHMIETKDKEIAKLMEHKNMRQMGLRCSEQLLQNDTQSFIDFFTRIKKKASQASHELEALKKKRNQEQQKLRQLSEQCSTKQTAINKYLEQLLEYNQIKEFTESVDPSHENKAMREQKRAKIKAHMEFKQQMVQARRKEREENERLKNMPQRGQQSRHTAQTSHSQPSDDEDDEALLDLQIDDKLLELIEDPDEDAEYPVPFESPDELMKIFTELEDQNLFLINQSQDNEDNIEQLKNEWVKLEKEMEKELSKQLHAKKDVDERIQKTKEEKVHLERKTKDGSKRIGEAGLSEMRETVNKIVENFEGATASRNQNDILDQLHVIEAQVSCYAEFDDQVRQLDGDGIPEKYQAAITMIKKAKRGMKNEARKKAMDAQKEMMNKRRAEQKKNIKATDGRQAMDWAGRPEHKKKKEIKQVRTQEDIDYHLYLGDDFMMEIEEQRAKDRGGVAHIKN